MFDNELMFRDGGTDLTATMAGSFIEVAPSSIP